jgi:hypothetical protein
MIKTKDKVSFSRETWENLRADDFFREVIEIIEDREAIQKAKKETTYFVDLEDYHNSRIKGKNV